MEEQTPCQRVLSITELVDHIYSFMDLKTAIQCRKVNRQWRDISDLYLKRRVSVKLVIDEKKCENPLTAAITFSENPQDEDDNLMDVGNVVYDYGPNIVVFALAVGAPAAPLMKLVLEMDFLRAITSAYFSLIFTIDDWILFRHQIFKKFDQLKSVEVDFRPGESRISLPEDQTAKYFKVKRTEFNFENLGKEDSPQMEWVVKDVLQMFPSLVTLKVWNFFVVTWLSRSNDGRDVNAEVNGKWEFGFHVLKDPSNVTHPIWTQVVPVFLKVAQAQLREIETNSADKVLSLLLADESLASQLEGLSLTHFSHHVAETTPVFLSSLKFNNLTSLYWSYFPDQLCGSDVTESVELVIGGYALPNLEMVHLERNYCQLLKQHAGLRLERWILVNLQRLAPNIKRLVASVYSRRLGRQDGFLAGDWLKVLQIASSLTHLGQIFLVNTQARGSSRWTDMNLEEVVPCLQSLKSINLIVEDPAILTESARLFMRAAARVETIENLNLYRRGSGQQEEAEIDLNLVAVANPNHLIVSSGQWTKEIAKALEVRVNDI